MVTKERWNRYKERHKKGDDEKTGKKIHEILEEIAKMRGYKEKLVGKRKVSAVEQYVDYLLEKNYKIKTIKKGEVYYDRKSEEERIADKNISAIEQYTGLLARQGLLAMRSLAEYNEWLARQEGFRSSKEKEDKEAAELGLLLEEYREYKAKERGFDSYEQYQDYLNIIYAIRGTYTKLIPKEDFDAVFKSIEDKWTRDHEKFIAFCEEFWKDSLGPYFEKSKKDEAVVFTNDVLNELDTFHKSRPGSLNIYNTDDVVIGLSYCMEKKDTDVIFSKDGKTIMLKKKKS